MLEYSVFTRFSHPRVHILSMLSFRITKAGESVLCGFVYTHCLILGWRKLCRVFTARSYSTLLSFTTFSALLSTSDCWGVDLGYLMTFCFRNCLSVVAGAARLTVELLPRELAVT